MLTPSTGNPVSRQEIRSVRPRLHLSPSRTTDMGKLAYRAYQPEDAEKLSRLHSSVFGVSRTPVFWHWKYRANPAGNDLSCVAEDTDTHQIVGENGVIPVRVGVNGEPVLACQSVDILVEEEYRRRLVHFELMARAGHRVMTSRPPLAFTFAFGEAVTIKVSSAVLGYSTVALIPRMVKPLSLAPYAPRLLRGAARAADPIFRSVTRPRKAPPPSGATVQRVAHFDARCDQFWRQQASRYPVAVWRDSAYLNWRYLEAPGGDYEAYSMERHGELLGFTVLRPVSLGGRRRGRILELVAAEDDEAIASSLLAHVLSRFGEQQLEVAVSWVLASDPLWRGMRRRGFLSRPRQGRALVVLAHNETVPHDFLTQAENWRVSMGDADEI